LSLAAFIKEFLNISDALWFGNGPIHRKPKTFTRLTDNCLIHRVRQFAHLSLNFYWSSKTAKLGLWGAVVSKKTYLQSKTCIESTDDRPVSSPHLIQFGALNCETKWLVSQLQTGLQHLLNHQ